MGLFSIFKKKAKPIDKKYVFDKAKFHDHSVHEMGLKEEQAFVHTGLFFAWLVNNGHMSDYFIKETTGDNIEQLNNRTISPSTIYVNWDGVFIGAMLNDKGFVFAMSYFDFEKGNYINDYKKVFNIGDDDFFTFEDTWENYERLRPVIESAYLQMHR